MFILQISDLHISKGSNKSVLLEKCHKLTEKLMLILPENADIMCCVLGDIIEGGKAEAYSVAREVLNDFFLGLKSTFGEGHIAITILPGNHDICKGNLSDFNVFASELLSEVIVYNDDKTVRIGQYFGYTFYSISTANNGEYHYGQVNFEELGAIDKEAILLTHHALVSSDKDDDAPIRNGYQLQKILEDNDSIALLHGHTHGCKRYTVGNNCHIIGVGPMFKDEVDISNQCNLLKIEGPSVRSIDVLTYHGDRECWDVTSFFKRNEDNYYFGTSVKAGYRKVQEEGAARSPLQNLCFQIVQPFNEFETEITENFSAYRDDALAWQSSECPFNMYYTHGALMNYDGKTWSDFVAKELENKPTTKRAIVPLINKEMVYGAGDKHLVSFDTVQFGFPDNKCQNLQITIYFRALEINHFLPVNLYETYLMAQKLREKIMSIDTVTVCIFSFRAEAKEKFNCYKKTSIEIMSETNYCSYLQQKRFEELRELLYEKADAGETVIETEWLEALTRATTEFYQKSNKEHVIAILQNTMQALVILKDARKRCSIYSETSIEEQKVMQCIKDFADAIVVN